MRENRTKIIATIGPACVNKSVLFKMMEAGMDACRLNFSHGAYSEFRQMIRNIREVSKKFKKEVAIIQDLQGPKIRVGKIQNNGIVLKEGSKIVLGSSEIPLQFHALANFVKKGHRIFIDDGKIELRVLTVNSSKKQIACLVKNGGFLENNKGINTPDSNIKTSPLTAKDIQDLKFGIQHGVDYVALSFVEKAQDIELLRGILKKHNSRAKIIAKIERKEAIKNLEEIVKAADAIMVARGDLGIEVQPEMVPLYQRKIVYLSQLHGKPVIVATQMLASMVSSPIATRAEISDAATAVFEHADCLMLSNETTVGKYPVKAVETLAKVSGAVERELLKHPSLRFSNEKQRFDLSLTNAACLSAAKMAQDIKAKCIVAITKTGYTALEIAKHRPVIPMIVFTPDISVGRQLSIVWDVKKVIIGHIPVSNPLPQVRKMLLAEKLAKTGDEVVICNAGFFRKEKFLTSTLV